jgi:HEAT repeat protein
LRGAEQEPLQEAIVGALGQIGGAARPALVSFARAGYRTADVDLAIRRSTDLILNASPSVEVDQLVQELFSRDASTRLRATKALAELGPAAKGATRALVITLSDPDGDVRRGAIVALRLIDPTAKPPEALIKALAQDLQNPDANLRLLAARSLGRLGPAAASAAPDLDAARADPDPDVRRAAIEALARVAVPLP